MSRDPVPTKGDRALSPDRARALAARLLAAAGYVEVGRSAGGESLYLEHPDRAGRIRISDHRTSPARRGRLPGPTVSIVVDACASTRRVESRVRDAVRDHVAAAGRRPHPS